MLIAEDLSYRFPHASSPAVVDFSGSWQAGKLCALIGPNGSGKTTLLRTLSGELIPHSGTVRWAQQPLIHIDPAVLARSRAMLSQSPRLDFSFKVVEVVALGRSPFAGQPEQSEDTTRIAAALRAVELEGWETRPYPELSRGEKQRVQLARVLAQLPSRGKERSALMLDEPTNHLDLAHQHRTLSLARDCAREGRLVITVLHDLNLALQYADRVVVLRAGRLMADGTPTEVLTPQLLAEVFHVRASLLHLNDGRPFLAIEGKSP